jgi:hypothetical protein
VFDSDQRRTERADALVRARIPFKAEEDPIL